jgi:hypothetical protein
VKQILRRLALLLAGAAVVTWFALGANRGWTLTKRPVRTVDVVTGIEGIDYQKRFVPGLDFLGVVLLGAGFLTGTSLFVRNQKPHNNEP